MKKIFLLFLLVCFSLPAMALDITTLETRETFFDDKIKSYDSKYYGTLNIKGIWKYKEHNLPRVNYEEIYCDLSFSQCFSSFSSFDLAGYPIIKKPYIDTFLNIYEIIEVNSKKLKAYSKLTKHTIEADLIKKSAFKYKVYENGDVDKYDLIIDSKKADVYIESIFNKFNN